MSWQGKKNSGGVKGSMSMREGTELAWGGFIVLEFMSRVKGKLVGNFMAL